jgi:hypothetical protein
MATVQLSLTLEQYEKLRPTLIEKGLISIPTPVSIAPSPVKTILPVFCTADRENLKKGEMKVSDMEGHVAFSYALRMNLAEAFNTMSEKAFKDMLKMQYRLDSGLITGREAYKIYNAMKVLTNNIGKEIVVAVSREFGGGLEVRKITGPYQYSEDFHYKHGGLGYFHQFPTKFVRKLSDEESKAVTAARPCCYDLTWSVELFM